MFVIRKMLSQLLGRRFHQRVPIVQQFSNNECGLACLVMILNYYGKHISLSECRQECAISRDGTTAETLARVAHSYGLRVKAFSVQNLDALKSIPYPAIAHWDFNHFVVVERWSPKNRVEVIDPALGRRYLTHDEFNKGFTGVVLVMEPGVQFDRQLITKSVYANWRIYIHHILSIPGLLSFFTQILIASLVLQMLGLTLPLLTKILIDQVLPLGDISVMTIIGIGIVILILTQPVAGYIRAILLIYLQTRLDSRIMLGFFEHLLGLPYQFFQHRSSGDLLLRLGSNALVREMLTGRTISVIFDGFLVFGYLFVLMALSPRFGTLVFFIGAIQVVILMVTTRSVHRLLQKDLATQAESQSYLVEALKGILTLKSSGAEPQALNHWSSLFYKQLNVSIQRNHLSAIIEITMGTVRTFSPIILLWAGAYYVLNGTMTLGTMLALNALGVAFLTPLALLVSTGQSLQLISAYLDRIVDVLEAKPEQVDKKKVAPALSGRIEVKDVSFRYSPDSAFTLRNISFSVNPGQKVAIVGRTGSGKSTLAMLLLGLYHPEQGTIFYDDYSLTSLDYRSLRSQFGVVLQEPFLFHGSIRQNISFLNPTLPLDKVRAIAQMTFIDQEVMQMPMTYETLVAEGGSLLSGGQRQRIAIARALAHEPNILLLDEATSHLDTETERLVEESLNALRCTRIVIAHRLSTVQNADMLLVLHDGQLVGQGTHDQLFLTNDHYRRLFTDQDLKVAL